jgi:hypothetical protein
MRLAAAFKVEEDLQRAWREERGREYGSMMDAFLKSVKGKAE